MGEAHLSAETRPAFYALSGGGWRDYVTLLHPPYTLWHLSYVAVGAALAPRMDWGLLGWTTLAFALAMGVGAHALDELHGRPLRTRIPDAVLWALAIGSITAATAIGIYACVAWTWWLAPFVVAGAFIVAAYVVEAETLRLEAVAAAAYAALLSYAQRVLSTPARAARREAGTVRPELETALMALAAASVAVAVAVLLVHV